MFLFHFPTLSLSLSLSVFSSFEEKEKSNTRTFFVSLPTSKMSGSGFGRFKELLKSVGRDGAEAAPAAAGAEVREQRRSFIDRHPKLFNASSFQTVSSHALSLSFSSTQNHRSRLLPTLRSRRTTAARKEQAPPRHPLDPQATEEQRQCRRLCLTRSSRGSFARRTRSRVSVFYCGFEVVIYMLMRRDN